MPYGVAVRSPGSPSRPSRRAVLLLGAAAPLAACELFDDEPTGTPTPAPQHPDDVVRERAVAAEDELLAWYDTVTTEHPELAEPLAPFRDRHERHLAALLATTQPVDPEATPSPGQTGPPAAASPPAAPQPPAPADQAAAIGQLGDAEIAAADDRLTDCLAARDGELAALLAGIAACEAAHNRLLRAVSA